MGREMMGDDGRGDALPPVPFLSTSPSLPLPFGMTISTTIYVER